CEAVDAQRRCRDDIKLHSVASCVAKCRGRTIRDYLIWNPLLPLVKHLTVTKKYVIIIPKQSGIYNIPIIPLVLTSTIFKKGKQEVTARIGMLILGCISCYYNVMSMTA